MRRLAAALAVLVTAAPAGASVARIASVRNVAALSAWHGQLVFSQYDEATKRWSLVATDRGGKLRRLNVAPQATPFDADAGPNAAGDPVAVFSRCPSSGQATPNADLAFGGRLGCRIHQVRLDLPGARDRRVRSIGRRGYSDGAPAIWRGRIAFGRVLEDPDGRYRSRIAAVFVQRAPGSQRLVRVARGTVPGCSRRSDTCYRVAIPRALDLGPSRLAFTWKLAGGDAIPQEDQELWSVPLDGRPGRLLDAGGAGECGFGGKYSFRSFGTPSIAAGRVSYVAYMGDCYVTDSTFTVAGPAWPTRSEYATRDDMIAWSAARDDTGWWWVRGGDIAVGPDGSMTDPCAESACPLLHSDRLPLRRVKVERAPRPPVDPSL